MGPMWAAALSISQTTVILPPEKIHWVPHPPKWDLIKRYANFKRIQIFLEKNNSDCWTRHRRQVKVVIHVHPICIVKSVALIFA
jgi:hypothetical protein